MTNLFDKLIKLAPYISFLAILVGGFNLAVISYITGHKILATLTVITFTGYVLWFQRKYILEKENEKDG
jgi:hypothetical protein